MYLPCVSLTRNSFSKFKEAISWMHLYFKVFKPLSRSMYCLYKAIFRFHVLSKLVQTTAATIYHNTSYILMAYSQHATVPNTAPVFHPTVWGEFFIDNSPEILQVYFCICTSVLDLLFFSQLDMTNAKCVDKEY
jgi:hypothetical protein